MKRLSLAGAKVLLGVALGVIAFLAMLLLLGSIFGFLKVFGWPAPNPTILDALLLAIAAIALVVYRKKYPKPTKDLPKGWFSKDQLTEIEKRVAIAKRCN